MKIVVSEIPKTGRDCLFCYTVNDEYCTCKFAETTVCFRDCGDACPYLVKSTSITVQDWKHPSCVVHLVLKKRKTISFKK